MTETPRRRGPRRATGGWTPPDRTEEPADGEVTAGGSRDETDVGWGERPASGDDDERILREVPPHW